MQFVGTSRLPQISLFGWKRNISFLFISESFEDLQGFLDTNTVHDSPQKKAA